MHAMAWCSSVILQNQQKLRDLEEKLSGAVKEKTRLSQELAHAQIGREETQDRAESLLALEKKQVQKVKLVRELEQYRSCDPQRLKELRECRPSTRYRLHIAMLAGEETAVAKEAANRWTGNLAEISGLGVDHFAYRKCVCCQVLV